MAAPGPRRSTRHRTVPDRLIQQDFIGSRRPAPNMWIRKRTTAKEACERARVECMGGVVPGAPAGAAPIPPNFDAVFYCEWISKACAYLVAALKAFQHAGTAPGSRNAYWPPPQPLSGAPVVGYALRDDAAIDEVTTAWEAAFDAIWYLLGFEPPIVPVLVRPPFARPNRLAGIRLCCDAGKSITELIRGERDYWLELDAYNDFLRYQRDLARLLEHPEDFHYHLNPVQKPDSQVALNVIEDLEHKLSAAEVANAAGVTGFLHNKPFQDHYDSRWVQALRPGGNPMVLPIPAAPPRWPIEKAIVGLTVALNQLAGHGLAYTQGRSAATAVNYPTIAARRALATRVAINIGYLTGGNLVADVTGDTGGVAAESVGASLGLP